jgi:hypothetical protein
LEETDEDDSTETSRNIRNRSENWENLEETDEDDSTETSSNKRNRSGNWKDPKSTEKDDSTETSSNKRNPSDNWENLEETDEDDSTETSSNKRNRSGNWKDPKSTEKDDSTETSSNRRNRSGDSKDEDDSINISNKIRNRSGNSKGSDRSEHTNEDDLLNNDFSNDRNAKPNSPKDQKPDLDRNATSDSHNSKIIDTRTNTSDNIDTIEWTMTIRLTPFTLLIFLSSMGFLSFVLYKRLSKKDSQADDPLLMVDEFD